MCADGEVSTAGGPSLASNRGVVTASDRLLKALSLLMGGCCLAHWDMWIICMSVCGRPTFASEQYEEVKSQS